LLLSFYVVSIGGAFWSWFVEHRWEREFTAKRAEQRGGTAGGRVKGRRIARYGSEKSTWHFAARGRTRQASVVKGNPAHIFTTLRGRAVSGRYVEAMVKRLAAKARIEKNVHPHTLRHTFATDLYREMTNTRRTQKALGHCNLATTQNYTHIVDEELEAAMKSFRQTTAVAV